MFLGRCMLVAFWDTGNYPLGPAQLLRLVALIRHWCRQRRKAYREIVMISS
jgi:hypothetical protein